MINKRVQHQLKIYTGQSDPFWTAVSPADYGAYQIFDTWEGVVK